MSLSRRICLLTTAADQRHRGPTLPRRRMTLNCSFGWLVSSSLQAASLGAGRIIWLVAYARDHLPSTYSDTELVILLHPIYRVCYSYI
jgi:hypothetical protein